MVETLFITLAVVAFSGGLVWLFLFEPRRKIYSSYERMLLLAITKSLSEGHA